MKDEIKVSMTFSSALIAKQIEDVRLGTKSESLIVDEDFFLISLILTSIFDGPQPLIPS